MLRIWRTLSCDAYMPWIGRWAKLAPRQRTGSVVDHQVLDVVVGDAGLTEGLATADAERVRGGVSFVTPRKAGVQGNARDLATLDSRLRARFRGNDGQG